MTKPKKAAISEAIEPEKLEPKPEAPAEEPEKKHEPKREAVPQLVESKGKFQLLKAGESYEIRTLSGQLVNPGLTLLEGRKMLYDLAR